jgi:hypothetical protein
MNLAMQHLALSKSWAYSLEDESGDNTVAATPGAGKRYLLHGLSLQRDTTTEATTVIVKGSGQILPTFFLNADVPMVWLEFSPPLILATNAALIVNLSAAQGIAVGYSVTIEAV